MYKTMWSPFLLEPLNLWVDDSTFFDWHMLFCGDQFFIGYNTPTHYHFYFDIEKQEPRRLTIEKERFELQTYGTPGLSFAQGNSVLIRINTHVYFFWLLFETNEIVHQNLSVLFPNDIQIWNALENSNFNRQEWQQQYQLFTSQKQLFVVQGLQDRSVDILRLLQYNGILRTSSSLHFPFFIVANIAGENFNNISIFIWDARQLKHTIEPDFQFQVQMQEYGRMDSFTFFWNYTNDMVAFISSPSTIFIFKQLNHCWTVMQPKVCLPNRAKFAMFVDDQHFILECAGSLSDQVEWIIQWGDLCKQFTWIQKDETFNTVSKTFVSHPEYIIQYNENIALQIHIPLFVQQFQCTFATFQQICEYSSAFVFSLFRQPAVHVFTWNRFVCFLTESDNNLLIHFYSHRSFDDFHIQYDGTSLVSLSDSLHKKKQTFGNHLLLFSFHPSLKFLFFDLHLLYTRVSRTIFTSHADLVGCFLSFLKNKETELKKTILARQKQRVPSVRSLKNRETTGVILSSPFVYAFDGVFIRWIFNNTKQV